MNKRETGTRYEELTAQVLIRHDYRILEKNYRCRQGEIDLIASEGGYLVFIEVKYRKDPAKGDPAEAVDYRKQRRIIDSARYYLYSHGYENDTKVRFDVALICGNKIRVIKNAFGE